MKLDEFEASKKLEAAEPSTTLTITHVSTIRDEKGDVVRHVEVFPRVDPDFHLGAVEA